LYDARSTWLLGRLYIILLNLAFAIFSGLGL